MASFSAAYVLVLQEATREALLTESVRAYSEPGANYFAIDDPSFGFTPEDELQALSARLDTDVIWLSCQSVVDAFEFQHWRQGTCLRNLIFGSRGLCEHERSWERIEGDVEPWEETAFAHLQASPKLERFEAGLSGCKTAKEVAIYYRLPGWSDYWAGA